MRTQTLVIAALLGLTAGGLSLSRAAASPSAAAGGGPAPDPALSPPPVETPGDDEALVCATGCSSAADGSLPLAASEYLALLERWATGSADAATLAFETLLFHGEHTRELVDLLGTPGLDEALAETLRAELARTRAWLSVRFVADDGGEPLVLDPTLVPLGIKQHLWPRTTAGLAPPEVSGTVHRVGRDHLWTRL